MPNRPELSLLDPDLEQKLRALGRHTEAWARSHPGTAESLVPVWGSTREAIADASDGDYMGAVGNTLLAVSDLIPAKALGGIAAKAAFKGASEADAALRAGGKVQAAVKEGVEAAKRTVFPPNPKKWKGETQKWYLEQGYRKPKVEAAHHWLIEQNSALGKKYPELINQLWNLKTLDHETHGRLRHGYLGRPRFNPAERLWYGMPGWAKATAVGAPLRVGVVTGETFQDKAQKR